MLRNVSILTISLQLGNIALRLSPGELLPKVTGIAGGGGALLYKGLMGTCGQPVYVFRDFCLKQGIDFIIFLSYQGIGFINFCLKQGIFSSWTINSLRECSKN